MKTDKRPLVWAIRDHNTGHASQVLGVAEALGWPYVIKEIHYNRLANLPNMLIGASLRGVTTEARLSLLCGPQPDVVIGCGRRTAPVVRWLGKRGCGQASSIATGRNAPYLCQIMWPGCGAGTRDFDLLPVLAHDRIWHPPASVLQVATAAHRVTAARLTFERGRWQELLSPDGRPIIAVLVGGSTRMRDFTVAMAQDLGHRVGSMVATMDAWLAVSTSRRTSADVADALFSALPRIAHAYRWGERDQNPYLGYLACADVVVVTGESVSMVSEACSTPAPVHVFAPEALLTHKIERFVQNLYAIGAARPLTTGTAPQVADTAKSLPNAAESIATVIRAAFVCR